MARRFPVIRALGLGLVITAAQVLVVCLLSGAPTPVEAYRRLHGWDADWYFLIARDGYRSTVPPDMTDPVNSNVAFFPGFPFLARAVHHISGLPLKDAVLLASQLACWAFWAYLLLLLRSWGVPDGTDLLAVLAVAVHPAAFYLVIGYSESLFLVSLVGFVYWAGRHQAGSWVLAGLHGFVMSATRIVGLPLAVYPLLEAGVTQVRKQTGLAERLRHFVRPALASALAVLGGLSFFAFCQWRFGAWDLYMQAQKAGWHVEPDYLVVFNFNIYRVFIPHFRSGLPDPLEVNQLSVPVTLACLVGLLVVEWQVARRYPASAWQERIGFYAVAWILFYVSVCGLKNRAMESMVRYSLSVHVVLVLAVVHLLLHLRPSEGWPWRLTKVGLAAAGLASLVLQMLLATEQLHGQWVA